MPYREGVVEELLDEKQNIEEEYQKYKYSQTPRVLFLLGFLAAPGKMQCIYMCLKFPLNSPTWCTTISSFSLHTDTVLRQAIPAPPTFKEDTFTS